jgi:pilus assembly protein Flp/PilA
MNGRGTRQDIAQRLPRSLLDGQAFSIETLLTLRGRCEKFGRGPFDMVRLLRALRKNKEGVTAIEYGLIAGAIAVAIIATVFALGGNIVNLFASTGNTISSETSNR